MKNASDDCLILQIPLTLTLRHSLGCIWFRDVIGIWRTVSLYTVKQLSDLAEVSVRTLHYYDEIDLLKPSKIGANNYRYYDESALLRLQQILFYRELGF